MEQQYKELIFKIIHILKMEKDHEGGEHVIMPSELLDKIAGMSHEIPEIRERIYQK